MKRCVRCRRPLSDEALFCPACGESQTGSSGDPLIGSIVGERYLVKEMLGRGASGTVYRARHVGLEREVAVKLLHHHLSNDKAAIERFRREATTVAAIENKHIIDVSDFGKAADGRFFIVMELLKGMTLADLLKKGRIDPRLGIDIVLQIGDGLTEAHALGYVHRDLRPGNIFLIEKKDKKHFVKLLDFGLSKLVLPGGDGLKSTIGFTFRDPLYLSPEQAKGYPVDRRSDIYSLAVILYHLLTGTPPFEGEDVTGVLDKHVECMPELPSSKNPEISGALDAVLMKAMAKNPESRYVTAFVFCEALRKAAAPLLKKESKAREEPTFRKYEKPQFSQPAGEKKPEQGKPPGKSRDAEARQDLSFDPSPERTLLGHGAPPAVAHENKPADIPIKKEEKKPQTEESAPSAPTAEKVLKTPEPVAEKPPGEPPGKDSIPAPEIIAQHGAELDVSEKEEKEEKNTGEEEKEEESKEEPQQETKDSPPDPSMSQLWYAEGEDAQRVLGEIETEADGEEGQKTLPALYEGWKPGSRLGDKRVFFGLIAAGVLIITVLLAVLYLMKKDGQDDRKDPQKAYMPEDREKEPDAEAAKETQAQDVEPRDEKNDEESVVPEEDSEVLVVPGHKLVLKPDEPPQKKKHETDKKKIRPKTDKKPEPEISPVKKEVSSSKDAKNQVEQGRAALGRGDLVAAGAHFIKARTMDPRNADALRGLGEVAFEQERYPAAIQHFRSALRLSSNTRTMVLLGNAYFRAGKLSEAEKMYERVLKRNSGHAEAKRNLELVRKRR